MISLMDRTQAALCDLWAACGAGGSHLAAAAGGYAVGQGFCHCPVLIGHIVGQPEAEVGWVVHKVCQGAVHRGCCKEAHVWTKVVAAHPAGMQASAHINGISSSGDLGPMLEHLVKLSSEHLSDVSLSPAAWLSVPDMFHQG